MFDLIGWEWIIAQRGETFPVRSVLHQMNDNARFYAKGVG